MADAAAKLGPSWGIIPVGGIIWLALDTVPDGFLLCNGAAVSRITYSRLFAATGTKWGAGNGSTTFTLPDMRGRVPWGANIAGSYISAGLPNITGTFGNRRGHVGDVFEYPPSGAFEFSGTSSNNTYNVLQETSYIFYGSIKLDASKSSTIYGASNTVQPPAATLLALIKY